MKIKTEEGYPDVWICTCGNTPNSEGFYACDIKGNEVEPTPELWDGIHYKCSSCGNIINQDTLEIVNKNT